MRQRGVAFQCLGHRLRIQPLGGAHEEGHGNPACFAGQLLQAGGVGAGGRRQDAAARRHEGADRGFHREMAAAGQGQRDMFVRRCLRDGQDAVANLPVKLAEIVVPRRVILRHGGLHPRIGRDRARYQQQHFESPWDRNRRWDLCVQN